MLTIKRKIRLMYLFPMVLLFSSCKPGSFEIIDHYKVYRYAEANSQGSSDDSNVLMCKLGGGSDPYIPNVKVIQWNQKYMVVETFSQFYLVDGSKNKLCCMCENLTKGPFGLDQIKQIIDSIQFEPLKKIEVYKHMKDE